MTSLPSGARVWLACGRTDMRKGIDGLAMLAQQVLAEDPFAAVAPGVEAAASPAAAAGRTDIPAATGCSASTP
jgi:transposase